MGVARPRRGVVLSLLALVAIALAGSSAALAGQNKLANANPPGVVYERVSYGPMPEERADIYASSVANSPTVILVHGGAWKKQSSLGFLKKEAKALQEHDFTVVNINYQQDSPNRPAFPLEPNDIITATQWAIAHAGAYNADPTDVALVGGSAGGNLVALAAEKLDAARPGTVKAVVSLSGPMNFETLLPLAENGVIKNHNFVKSIFQALGGSAEEGFIDENEDEEIPLTPPLWIEGSPALNIPSRGCPEWLLFSSQIDLVPVSQSREMYSDLLAAGCKATARGAPGQRSRVRLLEPGQLDDL